MASFSDIQTYARCPKKYEFAVVRNLQPVRPVRPQMQGRIMHLMFQNWYLLGISPDETAQLILDGSSTISGMDTKDIEDREMLEDSVVFVRGSLEHHADSWEVLHVEEEFVVVLDGHKLSVTPDLVVRQGSEGVWIVDHKSTTSLPREFDIQPTMQDLSYAMVVSNFYQVDGFIYNWIRKKRPRTPTLTKKGDRISRIGDIDTTYEILRDFVQHEAPFLTDDRLTRTRLADLREHNNFYLRQYLRYNAATLERVGDELVDWMVKIQENESQLYPRSWLKTGIYGCERCAFNPLCYAELSGLDGERVEQEFYEQRDPKNPYEERIDE